MPATSTKSATLYRMVTPEHICPYGLKSLDLLKRRGFDVDDCHLRSRAETDAFQARHEVDTTPQTFIAGERVGGLDDLRAYFGKPEPDPDATSYTPVVVIFALAALMAAAANWAAGGDLLRVRVVEWFVAFSMCILAVQKLRDLESFTNTFLGYDLLARRWVPYAYMYPFGEAVAGVLMISGILVWVSAPIALFIGGIGAVSVFKAVYVDKRELTCACAGGSSKVPLGIVSLSENLAMVGMAIWMIMKTAS